MRGLCLDPPAAAYLIFRIFTLRVRTKSRQAHHLGQVSGLVVVVEALADAGGIAVHAQT
jgi:hypothetical protein